MNDPDGNAAQRLRAEPATARSRAVARALDAVLPKHLRGDDVSGDRRPLGNGGDHQWIGDGIEEGAAPIPTPEPEEEQRLQWPKPLCPNPSCPLKLDREVERSIKRLDKLQKDLDQVTTEYDQIAGALWAMQLALGSIGGGLAYLLIHFLTGPVHAQ